MDGDRDVPRGWDGDRGTPTEAGGEREVPGATDGGRAARAEGDDEQDSPVEPDEEQGAPASGTEGGDPVELGVQLLARLEHAALELPEVIDRIETVTADPQTTRAILETAEARGHITRDGATVRPAGGQFLRFESEVVSREGEFDCRRCGASISTGYFMRLEAGEHGPFGSSCIRKVTGRE